MGVGLGNPTQALWLSWKIHSYSSNDHHCKMQLIGPPIKETITAKY